MGLRDLSDRRVRLGASALITAAVVAAGMTLALKAFFSDKPAVEQARTDAPAPIAQSAPRAVTDMTVATRKRGTIEREPPPFQAPSDDTVPFTADAKGQLVTTEETRLNLERLVALNSPQDMQIKLEEILRILPPPAARRLADLVERYGTYTASLRQAYPPGEAPVSEQDAIAQIDAIHVLRTQHFGAETASALFGNEERTQRELLELMRLEKDPTLTLQQRADRAQMHYQRLSELTREKTP